MLWPFWVIESLISIKPHKETVSFSTVSQNWRGRKTARMTAEQMAAQIKQLKHTTHSTFIFSWYVLGGSPSIFFSIWAAHTHFRDLPVLIWQFLQNRGGRFSEEMTIFVPLRRVMHLFHPNAERPPTGSQLQVQDPSIWRYLSDKSDNNYQKKKPPLKMKEMVITEDLLSCPWYPGDPDHFPKLLSASQSF